MAQRTIHDHPDFHRIQYDLARGISVRTLAKKYGVSIFSLYRLRERIPPQLKAAHMGARLKAGADLEKLRLDMSEGILQKIAMQEARLLLMQDSALEAGDSHAASMLAGRLLQCVELAGKYLGEFAQHQIRTTVSVLIQPEYLELRTTLMHVLARHPEARREVVEALHAVEAKAADPAKARPPMIEGSAQ